MSIDTLPSKADGTQWRNRIVGEGMEAPDQLLANPQNWRIHPKFQQDVLLSVLRDVGWIQEVIVNKMTGHLVDGHLRVTLAMRHEEKEIPVKYVELTQDEENLILATLDPLAGLAIVDDEKLRELHEQIQSDDIVIQAMLDRIVGDGDDIDELWQGMPEFEQEDMGPARTIHVHFASLDDVAVFANLITQKITDKTKYVWYPEQEAMNLKIVACQDES